MPTGRRASRWPAPGGRGLACTEQVIGDRDRPCAVVRGADGVTAQTCTARVPSPALVDPHPAFDPLTSETGVPECDAYLAAFTRLATCPMAGPALDGLKQGLQATRQGSAAWKTMPADQLEASKRAAAPGCRAGEGALRSTAASLGCPI